MPNGHLKLNYPINNHAQALIKAKSWPELDQLAAAWLSPTGTLRSILSEYCGFNSIEHILALRSHPDDEGIWHDDGSRLMAFSLSLTLDHYNVQGGEIFIRAKENELDCHQFSTQPLGTLIIFNTGRDGYEHRVSAVKSGERLVLAGWCS